MSYDDSGDGAVDRTVDRTVDRAVDLAAALRALRRSHDLSQRQLAERAGMPVSMLARIESGEVTNPAFRTVERLARAAGGTVSVDTHPGQPARPVPHEHRTDGAGRHYPAHLDVRVTYPFVGRDRRILPAGTAVPGYDLDRQRRDALRADEAAVAALVIEEATHAANGGRLWTARTAAGEPAGRLTAVRLPRQWPASVWERPEAVLCALETAPQWRDRGLEHRLLALLAAELAGSDPVELVTLAYRGPEAERLRGLGFHSRVRTLSLLTR